LPISARRSSRTGPIVSADMSSSQIIAEPQRAWIFRGLFFGSEIELRPLSRNRRFNNLIIFLNPFR
jgi:hypothetical protein